MLVGEFGEERRNFTPIGEIPQVIQDAVLAIEDVRFYQHGGVDYLGVIRAGLANFVESRSQGASTITMQLARNFYLSTEKTFTRKIYEILLALKIESQLSKRQILEIYMNQIYLGQRAYGFAAASEAYFGKSLKNITIAEAAMLAGLPKAPSAYNPIANPRRATVRQRYIIERMLENGFISEAERDAALAQPMQYRAPANVSQHAEHVAEAARQLIYAHYGAESYSRGLNVYLTLDSNEQTIAYRALRKGILDYERRQVYRGPEGHVELPTRPQELDSRIAEALGRASRQRRTEGGRGAAGEPVQGRRGAAERRKRDDHRRRPEAGDVRACRRRRARRCRCAAARSCGWSGAPRATGRSPSCPRSKARSSRSIRAPARCGRWSAASTSRTASSTT